MSFGRDISNVALAESFVHNILEIKDKKKSRIASGTIAAAEMALATAAKRCTLTDENFRIAEFRSDTERKKLRNLIFNDLISKKRLANDNKIELGKGGARPVGIDVMKDNIAFLLIGPPASGKSTIANRIADSIGAYIIDPDMVKLKLPEYTMPSVGADLVHEESSRMISGDGTSDGFEFEYKKGKYNGFLAYCLVHHYNIVIPKIGDKLNNINEICSFLKENSYQVFLVLVDADRQIAVQRAYDRFQSTGRYVPLTLVFDGYANNPQLTYYRSFTSENQLFDGYMYFDANVKPSKLIFRSSNIPNLKKI